jgi:hypothetical protein
MSNVEKIFNKMKRNPNDFRIEDVKTVANHYGLTGAWPCGGSSHITFRHSTGGKITIPAKKPIKPIYIKLFVKFIEELNKDE